jgi:hypothetical protein
VTPPEDYPGSPLAAEMRILINSPLVKAALQMLAKSRVHVLDGLPDLLNKAADELDAHWRAALEVKDRAKDALS